MRPRIRTIKPEAALDEELWDLGQETGLPVFQAFSMLWCHADRRGRFEWRPRSLKAGCLPFWEGDFSRVLDALTTRGFLVRYASGSREYGWIPTFEKHQFLNGREPESELPAPPDSVVISNTSRVADASTTRAPRDDPFRSLPDQKKIKKDDPIETTESPSSKVTCPPDLALTPAQRSTLEASMVPGWAIDVVTSEFVASAIADQGDRRQLVHWRKCLAKAVSGRWNDSSKRPKKPQGEPPTPEQIEAKNKAFEAKMAADRERRQKALLDRAKAEGVEIPPCPPKGAAQRAAILALAGGGR